MKNQDVMQEGAKQGQQESESEQQTEPTIVSMSEHNVQLPEDICRHLEKQYLDLYGGDSSKAARHFQNILQNMKIPPSVTICRLNLIKTERAEFLDDIGKALETQALLESDSSGVSVFQVCNHGVFDDVVEIKVKDEVLKAAISMYQYSSPPFSNTETEAPVRENHFQWPKNYKVIICDIFCGEAVLRGSNIFVKGILCADKGIVLGDKVAVYINILPNNNLSQYTRLKDRKTIPRGMNLENYTGKCTFLGIGVTKCSRAEMFASETGIGVEMCNGTIVKDDFFHALIIFYILMMLLFFKNIIND